MIVQGIGIEEAEGESWEAVEGSFQHVCTPERSGVSVTNLILWISWSLAVFRTLLRFVGGCAC